MTDRRRTFTFASEPAEPLNFTLEGTYAVVPPAPEANGARPRKGKASAEVAEPELPAGTWRESFDCFPMTAPQSLADLALARRVTAEGEPVWNAPAIIGFIRRCLLTDDDKQRFAALMNDPNRAVTIDQLGQVLIWLGEVYTERPTEPSYT